MLQSHRPLKYKDAAQSIETRVEDLLSRMTLQEKVDQICSVGDNGF